MCLYILLYSISLRATHPHNNYYLLPHSIGLRSLSKHPYPVYNRYLASVYISTELLIAYSIVCLYVLL